MPQYKVKSFKYLVYITLVGPLEYKIVKTPAIFTENESGTKKKLRRHSPPFTSLVVISCGWNKVTKGK